MVVAEATRAPMESLLFTDQYGGCVTVAERKQAAGRLLCFAPATDAHWLASERRGKLAGLMELPQGQPNSPPLHSTPRLSPPPSLTCAPDHTKALLTDNKPGCFVRARVAAAYHVAHSQRCRFLILKEGKRGARHLQGGMLHAHGRKQVQGLDL
ncbi:unnamed protein product [Pleuronectes platessa]|uniref:Uncharacterized protein n=1 Tax=Pleuronectes platessa TaxID=8262 RepID=A0A9N7UGU2_PLEPL|nr:unnamed protein product [Pleuronectes platessa]